jgi:hypothetical protein
MGAAPPRPSLRGRLESAQTTVTAEVGPPRGADPEAVRRKVAALRGWVDAVNITDSQSAHVRLSNWAGSILALAAGVEPVMQVTCRDPQPHRAPVRPAVRGRPRHPERAPDDRRPPAVRRPPRR